MNKNITPERIIDPHPCPGCGSMRIKLKVRVAYSTFYYQCVKCGCTTARMGKNIAEAVKLWNEMNGEKP